LFKDKLDDGQSAAGRSRISIYPTYISFSAAFYLSSKKSKNKVMALTSNLSLQNASDFHPQNQVCDSQMLFDLWLNPLRV
jgi:hypothetical protein